jgi:hypothetical protein
VAIQFADYGVEGLGEDWVGGVQAHPHTEPLRALAGEHEDGFAARSGLPGDHRCARLATRQFIEAGQQLVTVRAEQHRPVLEPGPAR